MSIKIQKGIDLVVVGVQGDHNLGTECVQFEMLRAISKTVLQILRGCVPELMPKDIPD